MTSQLTCEGVETLHDDEHVVYPDAKEEEGHHGVGRGVEEAEDGAEAVADHDPHHDPQDTAHAEVYLLLDTVPPAVTPLELETNLREVKRNRLHLLMGVNPQ